MSDIRVQFPKPCKESWDDMAPQGCNRHCAACDKTIHDLANVTADQAERLLDSGDEICVRARVKPSGEVTMAKNPGRSPHRVMALIGTALSLTLATAACQAPLVGPVSPRMEITGNIPEGNRGFRLELKSSTGEIYKARLDWDRKFKITNLKPGTYSLTVRGQCETTEFNNIIVSESDVDTGSLKLNEPDCIIIGVMTRTQESARA